MNKGVFKMERTSVICFTYLFAALLLNSRFAHADNDHGTGRMVVVQEAPETCERQTKDGDYLVIKYVGKYTDDGEQFDDNEGKEDAFHFKLGEGKVLPAWEENLKDMCTGEIREIFVPGTGPEGHVLPIPGGVVPDQTRGEVSYQIELVQILDKPPTPNLFKKMDFDGDNRISKEEMKSFFSAQGLGGLESEESLDSAVNNIFDFQDKDKDQWISFDEFPGQKHDEL